MSMVVQNAVRETRLAEVAAGAAKNDTFYYYLPMLHFKHTGFQLEWTAGAGGGTIVVTIEASCMPIAEVSSDHTALTYRDVTNAVFGVANFTDDFIAIDDVGQLVGCSYLRVKVIVANKDASTAYTLDARQSA